MMFNFFEFLFLPWLFLIIYFFFSNKTNYLFTNLFINLLNFNFNSASWLGIKSYNTNLNSCNTAVNFLAKSQLKNYTNLLLCIFSASLFVNIILSNILGLLPFFEAFTSNLGYTLSLSFCVWFSCVIIGFYYYGVKFIGLFIPSNSPWVMGFIFVLLEIISFCFRSISLGVRLWANMTSGHSLLQILTSMSLGLVFSLNVFISLPVSICVSGLLSTLVCLEYLICLLQSGVFIMLTGFYINEVWYKSNNLWSSLKA
jgi:F-type H+-transporting ATPase subunit a